MATSTGRHDIIIVKTMIFLRLLTGETPAFTITGKRWGDKQLPVQHNSSEPPNKMKACLVPIVCMLS